MSQAQEVYSILLRQAEKGNAGPVDILNTIIRQRDEAQEQLKTALSEYRSRLAEKLQLDHTARQTYSKTDIIIALDQIDLEEPS